ncbi:MAG: alpha/beta fold hydrolase [Proteobacteria bacterium]|nr:alpha/beta fold hydrolase [Pseudomonadota bacterium]MCP4918594.1 alpha/beta fold hydrolase [Pseudomonadota bacterium]
MSKLFSATVQGGPRRCLVLHGILGSGLNWRGFAKRMASENPGWSFELVDLRAHGRSTGFQAPHTVQSAAQDLLQLGPADAVIAHSFGGKVALAYGQVAPVNQIWVLDASPGPLPAAAMDGDVAQVIQAIGQVPMPLQTRTELIEFLRGRGFSRAIALWLTTNLTQGDGGLVWRFDLPAVRSLIGDYFHLDAWPWVDDRVRLVRAENGGRWAGEDLVRFEDHGGLVLKDSGHWVHVDNPDGLLDLIRLG